MYTSINFSQNKTDKHRANCSQTTSGQPVGGGGVGLWLYGAPYGLNNKMAGWEWGGG